jgi:hypothetical protein
MLTPNPNLLIISYYFPPYKRVGGRRWAKHAKYLNRLGFSTYVLAGDFLNSSSSWDEDIKEYKDKITRVKLIQDKTPFFKEGLPNNLYSKVVWKLSYWLWKIKIKLHKGNHKDISYINKHNFFNIAVKLITELKINRVLISVGPFRYSELLIDLKKTFPNIKCIIDYRDRWEDNCLELTKKQYEYEMKTQTNVLRNSDLILTVNDDITNYYRNLCKEKSVYTLLHAVDDDFYFERVDKLVPSNKEVYTFVYGGELYNGMEREIKTFIKFLKIFSKDIGKKSCARFYLSYPSYQDLLCIENENGIEIEMHPFLSKNEYKTILIESDFILLFRPEWSLESFSSKFFEILSIGKPVVYFGKAGIVSEFLIRNKLGWHIMEDNLKSIVNEVINNFKTNIIPDIKFDLTPYTFENQTKLLMFELRKL